MSDCCTITPETDGNAAPRLSCPRCRCKGESVSLLTLKHQVKPIHLATVEDGPFWLCATLDCPVVYFNGQGIELTLEDVRQRPTAKGGDNPQLCYCFGFDTAMARAEIATTGVCSIPERIKAEMKADRCACEIRNPQGSCCYSNVLLAVKRELAVGRTHSVEG